MSAIVPFTRSTFSGSDVDKNAPMILRADAVRVEASALALASAMNEDWATLTPSLRKRYLHAVVTAGMLIDPHDTKLLAYIVEGQMSSEFTQWDLPYRRQQTMALALALVESGSVLSGHQPRTLAARSSLLGSDEGLARAQHKGRGW